MFLCSSLTPHLLQASLELLLSPSLNQHWYPFILIILLSSLPTSATATFSPFTPKKVLLHPATLYIAIYLLPSLFPFPLLMCPLNSPPTCLLECLLLCLVHARWSWSVISFSAFVSVRLSAYLPACMPACLTVCLFFQSLSSFLCPPFFKIYCSEFRFLVLVKKKILKPFCCSVLP